MLSAAECSSDVDVQDRPAGFAARARAVAAEERALDSPALAGPRVLHVVKSESEVGQTIAFCRLLPRAFGPRNFMKKWAVPPRAGGLIGAFVPSHIFNGLRWFFDPVTQPGMTDHERRWSVPPVSVPSQMYKLKVAHALWRELRRRYTEALR